MVPTWLSPCCSGVPIPHPVPVGYPDCGGPTTPSCQTFAVLQTADGAAVLFAWHGYRGPPRVECASSLAALPMSGDERYRWLNDVVCTLTGEVRPRSDGSGPDVEYDVAELVWEPLA